MNAQASTGKAPKQKGVKVANEGIGGAKIAPKPAPAKAIKEAKPAAPIKLSMPITASAADINKAITSIATRGKKLDSDMHGAACASLHHVTMHSDPTLLNRLVLAMPKAARRNALVVWALKFGMVALNDDAKTREERPLVFNKAAKQNIEGAQAEPFFALKNVREGGSEWLYMDFIGNVMKTLEARAKAGGIEGARAKAAFDALNGVNEALALPANGKPAAVLPEGQTERRAVVH